MVEATLPTGVIRNNTEAVSGDIEKIDTLTVEELAKLWRAYSTKQKLLANHVGRRLENFFWRIWSSDRVRTTIRGAQVSVIFEDISQGHIIRTTPTSSPRNSRLYAVAQRAQDARQLSPQRSRHGQREDVLAAPQRPQAQQNPSSETIVPRKDSDTSQRDRSRPPPILKKPGSEYGTSNKTARIQTPGWKSGDIDPDHDEPMSPAEFAAQRKSSSPKFSLEEAEDDVIDELDVSPTTVVPVDHPSPATSQSLQSSKMTRNGSGQGSSSGLRGKRKGSFVVASSRRRPVTSRRQSSQAAGGSSSKLNSPSLKASRISQDNLATAGRRGSADKVVPSLELCASRSHSPVSESPFRRTAKDHEASERSRVPETVHREAAVLLAPRSQWLPLQEGHEDRLPTDMRRTSSASGLLLQSLVSSRTSSASMSSSNLQVAGTMTPTQSAAEKPTRQSVLGRATSLFTGKGKSKASFDLGPPENASASASRRTSVDTSADAQQAAPPAFTRSKSQSQLSGLLDQERQKDAQRDRQRVLEEQPGRRGKH